MKKVILLACIISGFTFLNAQLINSYGLKSGLCLANQDWYYTSPFSLDTQNHFGLSIGGFLELFNYSNFNLLIESHYIQKGVIFEITRTDEYGIYIGKFEYNNRVDYLSLPVLGKFAYKLKRSSPYILIGPRIDIFLGYDSENYDSVYDEFNSIDLGGTLGLGYEFNIFGTHSFLVEIRYSPSFTNSYDTEYLTVNNSSFEFLAGIKLSNSR